MELNSWRITNYEGSITGQCYIDPSKAVVFYATDNTVCMTENGAALKKTITFTGIEKFVKLPTQNSSENDRNSFGNGIAYDKINSNLYGVNTVKEINVP